MLAPLARAGDATPSTARTVTRVPIGLAYAGTAVNTCVFRVNAVASAGGFQFVTYYAADGSVVVARRKDNETTWDIATQPFNGKISDAHNVVVLGVSSDGLVHLSYDHHANPLHYRVSQKPYDIHSFGPEQPMTSTNEEHVTYPEFISGADGSLYYFYRDGASGNGSLCINRYDAATQKWQSLHHPLIDGENQCNPYPWRPAVGPDGAIHIAWCWRDSPDAQTNHDLCYTMSKDGGRTWLRSDGKPQMLPIVRSNAEVIDPIPQRSNLINQCSAAVDAAGHPHLVHYMNDTAGVPQYFHVWFDGSTWHRNQVSSRTQKFTLGGTGSLAIPISRPEIAVRPGGAVYVICRDAEFGGGVRLYRSTDPAYEKWEPIDLMHEDLGNWEPTYDIARAATNGTLSLFVLPVRQGNHERTTNFPPQEAALLETVLP
jgi:hypothetical protein